MGTKTIEISERILTELYRHYYNPATDYRDPVGTALWKEVEQILGPICLCGEDDNIDPSKSLQHKTWCPKEGE